MRKIIPLEKLDEVLDQTVEQADRFESVAADLIASYDAQDADLEIRDETSWRRGGKGPQRTSFVQQFRADVDAIQPMDRAEEARLARRIEFARMRLAKAREDAGLDTGAEGEPFLAAKPLPRAWLVG